MAVRRTAIRRSRRAPAIPTDLLLGAHMSIAGGFSRAAERAYVVGCTALAVFTKASNQWAAKPLDPDDVARFLLLRRRYGIRAVIAHSSYLINLASPDPALWERSLGAFEIELLRCEELRIEYLVFHPGAHVGAGTAAGIRAVAMALNRIHERRPDLSVRAVIETTAGQGTCLGHRFEEIRDILALLKEPQRVGICVDTCHLLAAGYDIRTSASCAETFALLDKMIGLEHVAAFHLNDSKKSLGSRVDRHAGIGAGEVGEEAFRWILNEPRLRPVPMVLETPKGEDEVRTDAGNLSRLVALATGSP